MRHYLVHPRRSGDPIKVIRLTDQLGDRAAEEWRRVGYEVTGPYGELKFCDQCGRHHQPPVSETGVDGPDCSLMDLYAWQVYEDSQWGVIAGGVSVFGEAIVAQLLIARSRAVVEHWRPLAEAHARETGLPVRLARFTLAETLEEIQIPPRGTNGPVEPKVV